VNTRSETSMSTSSPVQLQLFEQSVSRCTDQSAHPQPDVETLRFCVLGSGSSGNCAVVHLGDTAMMIDAGFGPRATTWRLEHAGLRLDDIQSICLTHLDRDHFSPNWIKTLLRHRISLYVHSRHVQSLYRIEGAPLLHREGLLHLVNEQVFEPLAGLKVQPILLPHDRKGTTGYLLETESRQIGYATDLGRVPKDLVCKFAGVDLLAIESNYDPLMQQASPRPAMLKRRIMNGYGHLSNHQAFEAVGQIMDASPNGRPLHVVLLHRSRQCNCPDLMRQLFEQDKRLSSRLTLTEQSSSTAWLDI